MDEDAKVDQACRTAEEFTKLYYESVDKRRHLMSKYYLDTGILSWNGNGTVGKDQIQKFYEQLPSTEHRLTSLDAQPVIDVAVSSQLTFVVQVSGFVKFQDKAQRPFQQNFVITAEGDKWKIVSDCFRLQEPVA
ncbi:NTF2-related export protein [Schistocerca americana]|uniref:NTF2-related export protein n=1 Tax=Schistocerca americana TaxID=7009 RepID=UPI001F4F1705|nr:NTF2-related export protein [Schistocerca americana]XP_047116410.1 NTF2-related export protein [Schistocerca piceifrons]XP_049784247.1 NTF2-related export protein [Schistocerca cancellata]XP_049814135.1 NTF2-related export protein [Schistocerca nitens]XP_049829774.1 NTF2-related export protein [Schistocerca gregaria]XP_049962310.1 NTF2-related export protein [Schistocerca serialis cubense]